MSEQRRGHARLQPVDGQDQSRPAAGSEPVHARTERAAGDTCVRRDRAAEELRAPPLPATHGRSANAERQREHTDARFRSDRAEIAEIRRDLAVVHSKLDRITAGVVALQTHSLRQTGGGALVLSVLIALAWKVIAG